MEQDNLQWRIAGVLQYVAVCCSVLQCVAVYCSTLQCVAVCCSVLQRDVVRTLLVCFAMCHFTYA